MPLMMSFIDKVSDVIVAFSSHDLKHHSNQDYEKQLVLSEVWGFTSFSTVFQSYQDDGRVNMKGSVQWGTF